MRARRRPSRRRPAAIRRHGAVGSEHAAARRPSPPSPARPRPPTASRPAARKTATNTRRSSPTASARRPPRRPRLTVDYVTYRSPASQTVNSGQDGTFTAASSNPSGDTVQWEVSSNGATAFTRHQRGDLDHLQLHGQQRGQWQQYEAVFSNGGGTLTSNVAMLTVDYVTDPSPPARRSMRATRQRSRWPVPTPAAAIRCNGR